LIDDEIVLARAAADGDTEKVKRLLDKWDHLTSGLAAVPESLKVLTMYMNDMLRYVKGPGPSKFQLQIPTIITNFRKP
jgi:hypothetical protein